MVYHERTGICLVLWFIMVAETNNDNGDGSITPRVVTQVAGLDRQLLAKIVPQVDGAKKQEIETAKAAALRVEWERNEALEEIRQAVMDLSPIPSDITNKIATLSTAQNVSKIRGLKSEIQQDIRKEIAQRQQEAEQTNAGLAQNAERAELIKALHQYDADTQAAREQMRKDGYGDTNNDAKLKALQAELDKEQEGSPRWFQIRDKMLELDEQYFKKVKNQAHQNGDAATEKNAGECATKAWEMRKKLAKEWQHEKDTKKGQNTTAVFKESGMRLEDDTKSPTAETEEIKITIANASLNEIEIPSGGKDRVSQRTSPKTV